MLGLFRSLFRRDPRRDLIAALYARVADAARQPGLYADLGVPDTVEGRFEALSVHMVLALRALRRKPDPAGDVARDLTDAFFRDLDASLREMGVGDTAVPKRMKTLAEAFYGRAGVYDAALDAGDETALAAALGRNVRGSDAPAQGLARYVLAADRRLASATAEAFLADGPRFPAPAEFAPPGTTSPAQAL
jgi:cytochrome b pre-mRNA-processing protein 3